MCSLRFKFKFKLQGEKSVNVCKLCFQDLSAPSQVVSSI